MREAIRCALGVGAVLLALGAGAADASLEQRVSLELFELLQEARQESGAAPLERRTALDDAAGERAAHVAGLPHQERLSVEQPIDELVRRAGLRLYRRVTLHLDMQRGFRFPASAFYRNWQKHGSWATLLDPSQDGVGLGTASGDDGWLVLAVVLQEDLDVPADLGPLERETADAVNAERRAHGLEPLRLDVALSAVARRHSEDMARRGFFDHHSPDGDGSADRVEREGLRFRKLAENIYRERGLEQPVASAVRAWMRSPGHRENILEPGYTISGVGLAVDADGQLFMTQLFLTP